ncbi:NADPH cytochrome P450 oxidoreductase family protein [Sphingobacterium sp. HMA12]|uniref:NADPH cytochrome P450 oxidoreductase family protein n=1 Tax=Sphingobacterium sp. HMA12 TaxID=2050894 RepID=UPI000CE9C26E|nr:NADPH cytochrome P450 oxidoreductase family protein [Sphingobacterium sp. HMA12]
MIETVMAVIHIDSIATISLERLLAIPISLLQIGGPIDKTGPIIFLIGALGLLFYILFGVILKNKMTSVGIDMSDNPNTGADAEFILLVGSETGGTRVFAKELMNQLANRGLKSYLADLNDYTEYPKAKYLMVLTSTYGEGDAPSSASRFLNRLQKIPQGQQINVSIVGLGSTDYADFCGYSERIFRALKEQSWADMPMPLYKVNDNNVEEFCEWIKALVNYYSLPLIASPALFSVKPKQLRTFVFIDRYFSEDEQLFRVRIKPDTNVNFTSGDLLSIYPADDNRERFYSVSRIGDAIELVVREFPGGLGSTFLKNTVLGNSVKARIMENPKFHFPDNKRPVIMIANGTGIAPFRGMINANRRVPVHLFYGSRQKDVYDNFLKQEMDYYLQSGKLSGQYLAFSRAEEKLYVTDLIRQQSGLVTQVLQDKGTIMICGSLAMQKDVLEEISLACQELLQVEIQTYLDSAQIVSDCY